MCSSSSSRVIISLSSKCNTFVRRGRENHELLNAGNLSNDDDGGGVDDGLSRPEDPP